MTIPVPRLAHAYRLQETQPRQGDPYLDLSYRRDRWRVNRNLSNDTVRRWSFELQVTKLFLPDASVPVPAPSFAQCHTMSKEQQIIQQIDPIGEGFRPRPPTRTLHECVSDERKGRIDCLDMKQKKQSPERNGPT